MYCPFYIIAACDQNNGIGLRNTIPWHLTGEMLHFKKVTTKTDDPAKHNVVIMGRSTWESLPEKFRPLPGRKNIVLSTRNDYNAPGAMLFSSLEEALDWSCSMTVSDGVEKVFVIGGQKLYEHAIAHPHLAGIYLTHIQSQFECDAFFPSLPAEFDKVENLGEAQENGVKFQFLLYGK